MHKIEGYSRTIRQLLSGAKYAVDYYQREYKWDTKQVAELLDDLSAKFLQDYEPANERSEVERYGHYFLGSIIISEKEAKKFIIDGQQRLTTLTLLLIHLNDLQSDQPKVVNTEDLIFSEKYGVKSFNLDVPDRKRCMEALFSGAPFDDAGEPESVRNIVARYRDIQELFPPELAANALPYFIDWLVENVHLVEITAYADEDAYTIFETMNDRGLSLSPTDMLKGYLLANVTEPRLRHSATEVWNKWTGKLGEFGREEDADCLKAWLRSQYANSIRERKRGALPQDFDRIGTEFHRWVRDQRDLLALKRGADFACFIQEDFSFYADQYLQLRKAAEHLTPDRETVFYNSQLNFTLQYPVLLAPLRASDAGELIGRKIRITGAYLDILLARRMWNFRAIDYSTMQYAMFLVMRDIRHKHPDELVTILGTRLQNDEETFSSNPRFRLHGQNRRQIHRILARMTDYVETRSRLPQRYPEYIVVSGARGYEVEHVWADRFEEHQDEFEHPADFGEYRNRIGGLLLLPKSFNASYGAMAYEKKREHYDSQNMLARSLHENCYDHNPGFLRFVSESGLPFVAHGDFKQADLDARQDLYARLADEIWSPNRLESEAAR